MDGRGNFRVQCSHDNSYDDICPSDCRFGSSSGHRRPAKGVRRRNAGGRWQAVRPVGDRRPRSALDLCHPQTKLQSRPHIDDGVDKSCGGRQLPVPAAKEFPRGRPVLGQRIRIVGRHGAYWLGAGHATGSQAVRRAGEKSGNCPARFVARRIRDRLGLEAGRKIADCSP